MGQSQSASSPTPASTAAPPTTTASAAAAAGSSTDSTASTQPAEDGGGPGFDRLNIPYIIDKVDVTDPDLIRMINTHPDVDRLHAVSTDDKPWWIQLYFPTTRFLDTRDDMFLPLTSAKDPRYAERRAYVVENVEDGVHQEDVKKIAFLLHTNAPQEELERAVVNGVNRRFYGKDVPNEVVESAGKTSDKLLDMITSGYFPPRIHQKRVLDFIKGNPEKLNGCPFADFSHHIGAAVQLLAPSCQYLHKETDRSKDVLDIFTREDMPMTIQTPRICIEDTTLGGMLDKPAKAGKTVFILQIREAAAKTRDPLFTFGAGVDERQCAFKFAFQKLMRDLQVELKQLEAPGGVAAPSDGGVTSTEG